MLVWMHGAALSVLLKEHKTVRFTNNNTNNSLSR